MQHGEKLNTITHLGGAVLAFGASIPLLARAFHGNGHLGLFSTAVYAVSLVLMYACSTAYHGASGSLKKLLQRFDHLSIYLLIAGSYTPFCMLMLGGSEAWILLGVVWGLALVGILQETRPHRGALVGHHHAGTAARGTGHGRLRLAARRRHCLYGGDRVLCARRAAAPCARDLASVRAGRERGALCDDLLVRPLTGAISDEALLNCRGQVTQWNKMQYVWNIKED
jgi:hypothetical protein